MAGEKVKLLCSFGGDFISQQGKAFYMGGKTRLVSIDRSASFRSLLSKMSELCNADPSSLDVKFQLPDGGLDFRLISVETDDDVRIMMEEFDSNRKIPIFLFTDKTQNTDDDEIAIEDSVPTLETAATEIVRCAAEGCKWRVHTSKLPQVSTFRIRTLTPEQTCVRSEDAGHRQATAKWIANCIREKLRHNQNYKPREILNDMRWGYGVLTTYKRAFLGREKALEELRAEPASNMVPIESSNEAIMDNISEVQTWGEIHNHNPPRKKRAYRPGQPKEVRPLHCNRCNQIGHNRRICAVAESMQDGISYRTNGPAR